MYTSRFPRILISCVIVCLVFLVAASAPLSSTRAARAPAHERGPTISTSCPAPGTARAASMPSMKLGPDPNIVYIVNEGTPSQQTAGTLKRYDIVTGTKVEIVKLVNTFISGAQVSADGQWLLFVASASGQAKLQLVRMDGQFLQTLYCGGPGFVQWSTNQQLVVFVDSAGIYLLNMTNGGLQVELPFPDGGTAHPRTWLDNTRVYVATQRPDSPENLAILDTSKGPNQTFDNLQQVFDATTSTPFCWDFDSSFDATKLFISQCTRAAIGPGFGPAHGPSVITVHPPIGGPSYTYLYVDQGLAFRAIRAVTSNTLLFIVGNESGNTSQNGLWKVGTDGSNPLRLAGTPGSTNSQLNQFTQYPWSNVSRDGSKYVLQIVTSSASNTTYTLEYGSLSGGSPFVFASITNVQLATVGWTTM